MSISRGQLVKAVKFQMNYIAVALPEVEKIFGRGWKKESLEPKVSSSDPTFTIVGSAQVQRPSLESLTIKIGDIRDIKITDLGMCEHSLSIDRPAYERTLEAMQPAHREAWLNFARKPNFSKPYLFLETDGLISVRNNSGVGANLEWALKDIWLATVAPWDQDELERIRKARKKGEEYMAASKIELLESEMLKWIKRIEREKVAANV